MALANLAVFEGKVLNSNSSGIRGATEHDYARQADMRRIVVLGDSFTFGEEVSDRETYCHFLDELLPDSEVLNLGVHGYGHDPMLLYLREEGVRYRPDVVIVAFVSADIYRNIMGFTDYWKPRFVLRGEELVLTRTPVPTPDEVLRAEFARSKAWDLGAVLFDNLRWTWGFNEKRARKITVAIFDELVATTREAGAVPVFAYLPMMDEILIEDPAFHEFERFVDSYCETRQVHCVMLRQRFLDERRAGVEFRTAGHWHVPGHRAAARGIHDSLVEAGLAGSSVR
jgi:hypothetical protein